MNIKENDPTNPINPYSQSKLDFEKEALEMKCKYIWKNNTIVNLKS